MENAPIRGVFEK